MRLQPLNQDIRNSACSRSETPGSSADAPAARTPRRAAAATRRASTPASPSLTTAFPDPASSRRPRRTIPGRDRRARSRHDAGVSRGYGRLSRRTTSRRAGRDCCFSTIRARSCWPRAALLGGGLQQSLFLRVELDAEAAAAPFGWTSPRQRVNRSPPRRSSSSTPRRSRSPRWGEGIEALELGLAFAGAREENLFLAGERLAARAACRPRASNTRRDTLPAHRCADPRNAARALCRRVGSHRRPEGGRSLRRFPRSD